MILHMGGGGANGLAIDILGGTAQPSGVANRIWLNTATSIGTVTVDDAAPASPAAGDVYIELDASSAAVVQLGKGARIVMLPMGIAYQYQSDAWVSLDAYVYLSGSWVTFSTDIPDGDTTTPVNDTNTWLRCAGISPSAEGNPTLAQVVANQSLCTTLMNSQNAVNYMIRSTTLQTAVLGSTTATAALDASTPYISTMQIQEDGGAVYGTPFDLLLTLTDPVWPYRVKYSARSNDPANGLPSLVQGSVDNVNWINVTNEVSQTGYAGWDENGIITYTPLAVSSAFKYYRVRILSGGNVQKYIKFQLYGKVEG